MMHDRYVVHLQLFTDSNQHLQTNKVPTTTNTYIQIPTATYTYHTTTYGHIPYPGTSTPTPQVLSTVPPIQ